MERRNLLGRLAALPLIGSIATATAAVDQKRSLKIMMKSGARSHRSGSRAMEREVTATRRFSFRWSNGLIASLLSSPRTAKPGQSRPRYQPLTLQRSR
jgi:hypothetical protein